MRGDFGDTYGGYSGGDYSNSGDGGKPWNDELSRSPASHARCDDRSERQDAFERWIETVEFLPSEAVVTRLGGRGGNATGSADTPLYSTTLPLAKSMTGTDGEVLASASAPLTFGLTPHPDDFTTDYKPPVTARLTGKRLGAVMVLALLGSMGVGSLVKPWTTVEGHVPFSGTKQLAGELFVAEQAMHYLPAGTAPGFLADPALRNKLIETGTAIHSTLTLRLVQQGGPPSGEDKARLAALLAAARDASGAGWSPDSTIGDLRRQRAELTGRLIDAWLKVAQAAHEPLVTTVGVEESQPSTAVPFFVDPALPARDAYLEAVAARDAILKKLSEPGGTDETKKSLDDAAARFEKALAAVNANQSADPALAAFAKAAADIQSQTQQLTDDLLERRLEQVTRLEQLKRRLTDRMKIRQEKAWAADSQLAQLMQQLSTVDRRRSAAEESGAVNAASELTGEKQYLESMIDARKSVLGTDPGDTRAVAEVQSLIDEATTGAEADKAAANQRLAAQRKKLDGMLAGTLDESRRKQAADLQQRLDELGLARQAYAKSQESRAGGPADNNTLTQQRQQLEQQLAAAQQKVDALNGQVLAHLVAVGMQRFMPDGAGPAVVEVPPILKAKGKAVAVATVNATAESKDIISRWVALGKEIAAREDRERRQVVPPAIAVVARTDPRKSWALATFALVLGLGRLLFAKRTEEKAEQPAEALIDEAYTV